MDPHEIRSSTLFRALHSWSSRPAMGGRLHVIGKSGQARAAAASAGAGRRLELRHGDRVPTRAKERAAQDFELQETMRCVRRVSRGFGDCATSRTRTQFRKRIILSVPPTHPTSPFHSLAVRCCMASERSCSLGRYGSPLYRIYLRLRASQKGWTALRI